MTAIMLKPELNRLLTITFAIILAVNIVITNLHSAQPESVASISIADSVAGTTIGAHPGGCGLLVGAVGVVVAVAAGGATIGFGAALAISATIHAGAILCAS